MGHHHRRKADPPFEIQLPITPMLDMSFQLLAYFMLIFKPASVAEGQLDMFLPAAGQSKAAAPADVDPFATADKDLEEKSDISVVVEQTGGVISKLTIREKEGNTVVENTKLLKEKLIKLRTGLANQNAIKIESESDSRYAFLIEVMDACLGAGFKSVGFAPPTDLGRN